MQVKILGSAAGGGFPQWNCACSNCARLRAGNFHGSARTQAQLAVRESGRPWCLINASPDLRAQILADVDFTPRAAPRDSPIAAVVLSGADVDQVAGLLHLREFHSFRIYGTAYVEALLHEENSIFSALHQTHPQAEWKLISAGKDRRRASDGWKRARPENYGAEDRGQRPLVRAAEIFLLRGTRRLRRCWGFTSRRRMARKFFARRRCRGWKIPGWQTGIRATQF